MNVRLVNIIGVPPTWESEHTVRVLEVNGRSMLNDLQILARSHPEDYSQILIAIRLVAESKRVENPKRVKKCKKYTDIYELRGGSARLFFFYTSDQSEVVVCTNQYWKAKPSADEQDVAIARAERLRQVYLASLSQEKNP